MQYFRILSRALCCDVDVRSACVRDAEGVVGDVAMRAMLGRRQWSRRRNSEDGFVLIAKRALRLGWSLCGSRDLWKRKPEVARRQTDAIVRTKSGAARRRGERMPSPPPDRPSCAMLMA